MPARLRVYASGEVVWSSWAYLPPLLLPPKRTPSRTMSRASATAMRRYCENCLAEYRLMVTLTYKEQPLVPHRDLRAFLKRLARLHARGVKCSGSPFSSFWFREYQRRGTVHYHVYLAGFSYVAWRWVARNWASVVGENASLGAGTSIQAISTREAGWLYARKYATKSCQKEIPDGVPAQGQWWGVEGSRATKPGWVFENEPSFAPSANSLFYRDASQPWAPDPTDVLYHRERARKFGPLEASEPWRPPRSAMAEALASRLSNRGVVISTVLGALGPPLWCYSGDTVVLLRYGECGPDAFSRLEATWLSGCVSAE